MRVATRIKVNGAKVKEARRKMKMSQTEFGKMMGISQRGISYCEHDGLLDSDRAERVRKFLGIRRKTFYPDLKTEPAKENKHGEITIAEYIKGLQAESPKKASDLIKELGGCAEQGI